MTAETYTTMQNDAWDAIAYRLWGEERLFMDLVKANQEHTDVVLFPSGVVLRIPPTPSRVIKQDLPPWM